MRHPQRRVAPQAGDTSGLAGRIFPGRAKTSPPQIWQRRCRRGSCARTRRAVARWARRQPGAVVEFGGELLLVQGPRKLALDRQGRPLWAVHLGRDALEQTNLITAEPTRWHWSPAWRQLRRWGRQEWRRRSGSGWIWRRLGRPAPELHPLEPQS